MYQVLINPRLSQGRYGESINVTRNVDIRGLTKISQKVDSSDFSIVQSYDSLRMKFINDQGRFSLGTNNTIFPYTRDESRVTVRFTDSGGVTHVSFQGLINDTATYEDERNRTIKLVVVSLDSVFKRVLCPNLFAGITFKRAFWLLLNQEMVMHNIIVLFENINPAVDRVISSASWFTNRTLQEGIDALLLLSNSRLYIDSLRRVHITSSEPVNEIKRAFYGPYDTRRRSPIVLEIKDINTGDQRVFNSIEINENTILDQSSINTHGVRSVGSFDYPFVTDQTARELGRLIIENLLWPQEEIQIKVLSEFVQDIQLMDIVNIDSPSLVQTIGGQNFLPLFDSEEENQVIAMETGKNITPNITWQVFEKVENPQSYNCVLKLRQTARPIRTILNLTWGLSNWGETVWG